MNEERTPKIRTSIRKTESGHMTQIWRDNKIIEIVPTHPSQIRDDKPYLCKVGDDKIQAD